MVTLEPCPGKESISSAILLKASSLELFSKELILFLYSSKIHFFSSAFGKKASVVSIILSVVIDEVDDSLIWSVAIDAGEGSVIWLVLWMLC